MKSNFLRMTRYMAAAAAVITAMTGIASASDSVRVSISNATGAPSIVNNGKAVGTIQLFYTVNATEFTPGEFASFDLDWQTVLGKRATNYGAGLTFTIAQKQQGGYVDLVPSPDSFFLTGPGQTGTSRITVYIGNNKDGQAPSNLDGTDLVGNLTLDAGSDVSTVSNIQVHIRLVHPTSCIKVYNFVTDQDFSVGILSTTDLNSPARGANAGKVNSSQPGQFSDNVLVANVCGTSHSFDLRITLDGNFSTNPVNNPGNAVFAYSGSGEFDPATAATLVTPGGGVGYQQNLCLGGLSIAPNSSLLVTVHSQIKNDVLVTSLPEDRTFRFAAGLYQPASPACSGPADALASPNPASFALPFTVNGN
jgi:hypothetical protein